MTAKNKSKLEPVWASPAPPTIDDLLLGTFRCPVDATGRIKVPKPFLKGLRIADGQLEIGISLSRSEDCISGCGMDFAFHFIRSQAIRIPISKTGLIQLPAEWLRNLGITDAAIVRGMGRTFQVWEPGTLEQHESDTIKRLQEKRQQN